MNHPLQLLLVAGTRPNFIKIASLIRALRERPRHFDPFILHTGQHYDDSLSSVFFDDLGIPRPDHNLDVGSGSHAQQTAEIMRRFEPVLIENDPDGVVVVGDVNSTIACALVASKLGIPVAHVEAGLRSFDRSMPEEINRTLTDAISELLFVSERSGLENLEREGVPREKVFFVGNVMIDTLLQHRQKAESSEIHRTLGLEARQYAVLTIHRPSNVDDAPTIRRILGAMSRIAREIPVVLPIHPRTLDRLVKLGLQEELEATAGLRTIPPLGYLDFLKLQADARLVLTDSGGIQEETTVLRVPCVTLRENTERPITISRGTNVLVGTDPERIVSEALRTLRGESPVPTEPPELWDGKAAGRIADVLARELPPRRSGRHQGE